MGTLIVTSLLEQPILENLDQIKEIYDKAVISITEDINN